MRTVHPFMLVVAQGTDHARRVRTFTTLRPQAFDVSGADAVRDFRQPPHKLSEIKRYVFNGFKRCCYWQAKFDSDTERQMAVLLERDDDVHLWMKLGRPIQDL